MIQLAKEFISVKQFSKKIGKKTSWIYLMIQDKRIEPEPVLIGEKILINKNAKIIKKAQ